MATEYKQPETGLGSVEETNRLLQEASKQTGISAPTFSPNGAITSEILAGGESPIQLPDAPVPTYQKTPIVPLPTGTTTDKTGIATYTPPPPAKETQQESLYQATLRKLGLAGEQLGEKAEFTKRVQEETQLAAKREKSAQSYNAYQQAQLDLTRQVEALAGSGLSDVQRTAREKEMRRVGNSNIANLAIQAQADQNLLGAAEQTIKDKIDAQFSPIQDTIDFLTKFGTLASNDLTESEQLTLSSNIAQQKTDLANITSVADTLHQAMLQNGAPQSTYSAIDKISEDFISGRITAQEAQSRMYQAARNYGVDISKQLSIQKSRLDIQKLQQEINDQKLGTIITNPNAGQYAGALSVILGSGKFTKEQKADVIRSVNNGEDPFVVIKNQAKNVMGQTLATQLDKYETAKSQMVSIDNLLTQYYASGGKTNLLGGSYEKVINKLGEVDNPILVEIATNISSALQIYRNAVSGTAYSVQEGKDIASIFPGINKSQGLNEAILSGRMKAFDTTIDGQYRNTLGSTYDELKKAQSTQNVDDPLNVGTNT